MSVTVRRVRGLLLRLARSRIVATVCGLALVIPTLVLWTGDFGWESWLTDGLALVLGSSGAALVLTGLGGHRPDWIDPDDPPPPPTQQVR